ncbi:MAG: prenyltransferase/squalene oxidase repeat-containing protein [Planctomycetota bacterium]|jgi:hypothetical protein
MSRTERYRYVMGMEDGGTFDEQLYGALRQSPWWMLSTAIHVLAFVVAGLVASETVTAASGPAVVVEVAATPEIDEQVDTPPSPTKPVDPVETFSPDPLPVQPDVVDDITRQDVDLPYEGAFGLEGNAMANLTGPSNNSWVGLGPGAGGAFGRGSNRDTGRIGGPTGATEEAVELALQWLAAHQSPNGGWEAAGFSRWCNGRPVAEGPDGEGGAMYDAGVTGLALLAFLGAGYTNRGSHPYTRVVGKGLRYLKSVQDPEGCFGPRTSQHFIYNHATAALAMVEAYGMTGSPIFRPSAQKALDFICLARNPYFAWRYGVKPGDNDSSVSGWMMMALKSATIVNEAATARGADAPLRIDEDAFDGLRTWIEKMTDPDYGRVGYVSRGSGSARPQGLVDRFPAEKTEDRGSEDIRRGTALCTNLLPTWNESDGSIDMYYWYYGTLAMFQVGGRAWAAWNDAMKPAIVDHQRRDTDFCMYKGSWDPIGPWGGDGGRVYSTALMAMCLQVYYRYGRVFGTR